MTPWKNKLYYGDNLPIMRDLADESVDLIYLDPPFNSKATYNVLFREKNGSDSAAQITAFDDTWHWDINAEETYRDILTSGHPKLVDLMQALRAFLGQNDMMAYLTMMAVRLVEMRRVLKETGSIYLHCDPTASHYLKILMDAVFNVRNFRNEITWRRSFAHGDAKQGAKHFGRCTDSLLFYVKSDMVTWNPQYVPYSEEALKRDYKYKEEQTCRIYRLAPVDGPGGASKGNPHYEFLGVQGYWRFNREKMQKLYDQGRIVRSSTSKSLSQKMYLDEAKGRPVDNLWDDINRISPTSYERLGYPTQKPEALLERIIKASSREGDVVCDPFCGCGTAVTAAEKLNRRWIGIDITHLAITLIKHRMEDSFGQELAPYEIIGDPKDLESAKALAEADKYQFEWWALSLVDARPAQDKKKGADRGVDGYIYFMDDESGQAKKIVVQVKSGHVSAAQVRDLKGTIEREKAVIGVFITLSEPTGPMKTEAASAGFYETEISASHRVMHYPRLQIFTIEELLNGKYVEFPQWALEATIKKASRVRKKRDESKQTSLL